MPIATKALGYPEMESFPPFAQSPTYGMWPNYIITQ